MAKPRTLANTVADGGPLATPGEVDLPGGVQGSVPYQSAPGQTALLAPGTAGHVLTSGGAGANPTWAPAVTSPAGTTGQVQINNAGSFGALASGTSGQALVSQGAGAAPAFGTLGAVGGGTGLTSPGAAGNVLTSNGTTWTSAAPAPSAGSITATASGAISTGAPVIINSDGTVSAVTATANTASAFTTVASASGGTTVNGFGNASSVFTTDTINGITVMWFRNSSTTVLSAVAMRINSSGTLQLGGVYTGSSRTQVANNFRAVFCENSGGTPVHVAATHDAGTVYLCSISVDPSTLAITERQYSPYVSDFGGGLAIGYNPVLNRICYTSYRNDVTDKLITSLGINSNGSLNSSGANTIFLGETYTGQEVFVYEPVSQRLIFIQRTSASGGLAQAYVLGFSGSTISIASGPTQVASQFAGSDICANPVGSSRIVVGFSNASGTLVLVVGTVSGSSISFGSIQTAGLQPRFGFSALVVTGTGQAFVQSGGYYQSISITGSTITFGTVYSFPSGSLGNNFWWSIDSIGSIFYSQAVASPTITAGTLNPYITNLTANNFIGFSAGAYSNGSTATVNTVGSSDNNRTGLIAGTRYFLTVTGALSTTATTAPYAGVALSSTRILIKG